MQEDREKSEVVAEPPAAYLPASERVPHISGFGAFQVAQEELKIRITRAAAALEEAGIGYAVIGGNAVAEHVGRVDPEAIRTTVDVDLLMEPAGIEIAKEPMGTAGFRYQYAAGGHMFMDGPSARSAVHMIPAGVKVREEYLEPAPTLEHVERAAEGFTVIALKQLVIMKLTSFRDKDRMHLRDMIDVGLLPGDILADLRPEFRDRLQFLLDNPE